MITVLITLTIAGSDTGPFDLYSDTDGFVTPFETGVTKSALLAGYTTSLVPDSTGTIKVVSTGECTNYIFIVIGATTTTTTTTPPPITYDLYLANQYLCGTDELVGETVVAFESGTSVNFSKYYNSLIDGGIFAYRLTALATEGPGLILNPEPFDSIFIACSIIV